MNELLCDSTAEAYKGHVHLALGMLAAVCAAYNLGAAVCRPSCQLTTQAGLYTLLTLFEARQVYNHYTAVTRRVECSIHTSKLGC